MLHSRQYSECKEAAMPFPSAIDFARRLGKLAAASPPLTPLKPPSGAGARPISTPATPKPASQPGGLLNVSAEKPYSFTGGNTSAEKPYSFTGGNTSAEKPYSFTGGNTSLGKDMNAPAALPGGVGAYPPGTPAATGNPYTPAAQPNPIPALDTGTDEIGGGNFGDSGSSPGGQNAIAKAGPNDAAAMGKEQGTLPTASSGGHYSVKSNGNPVPLPGAGVAPATAKGTSPVPNNAQGSRQNNPMQLRRQQLMQQQRSMPKKRLMPQPRLQPSKSQQPRAIYKGGSYGSAVDIPELMRKLTGGQ